MTEKMAEVIPISKTPTQEKVPFLAPKLDWNENGKKSLNLAFNLPDENFLLMIKSLILISYINLDWKFPTFNFQY